VPNFLSEGIILLPTLHDFRGFFHDLIEIQTHLLEALLTFRDELIAGFLLHDYLPERRQNPVRVLALRPPKRCDL
jgi:hypothetical protein